MNKNKNKNKNIYLSTRNSKVHTIATMIQYDMVNDNCQQAAFKQNILCQEGEVGEKE